MMITGIVLYSAFPVFADEDYIQIDNFWTYNAYKYFELYGLTPDTTTSSTQVYTTSGTTSNTASIQLTGTETQGGTIDAEMGFYLTTETHGGSGSIWIPNSVTMDIDADNNTGTATYPSMACVYNTQSTSTSAVMTCSPQSAGNFTDGNYELTINTVGDAGDGSGGLFAYIKKTQEENSLTVGAGDDNIFTGTFTLSGSFTESGSIAGSGTITTTTTTTNIDNLNFVYPVLSGSINNNYSSLKEFRANASNPETMIILYPSLSPYTLQNYIEMYDINSNLIDCTFVNNVRAHIGAYTLLSVSYYPTNSSTSRTYLKFKDGFNTNIIPLYVGRFNCIPDELYRYVYGKDRLYDLIESGNTDSQASQVDLQDTTDILDDKIDDLNTADQIAKDNLDDSLTDIDSNFKVSDISDSNLFDNSIEWVSRQFTDIITMSAFNFAGKDILLKIITFSLTLGIALTIIGKLRNR